MQRERPKTLTSADWQNQGTMNRKRGLRRETWLIMLGNQVPREEGMTEGRVGKDSEFIACLLPSWFIFAPSLHLLPRTSRIFFQQDFCYLCLYSIPKPQWTLPGSPLWAVVLGTYHVKEGV